MFKFSRRKSTGLYEKYLKINPATYKKYDKFCIKIDDIHMMSDFLGFFF